jgi:hypothetical protein
MRTVLKKSALRRVQDAFGNIDEIVRPRIELWDIDETESTFNDTQLEELPKRSISDIIEDFLEREKENLLCQQGSELTQLLRDFLLKIKQTPKPTQIPKKSIPSAPPLKAKKIPPAPPLKRKIPAPPPIRKKGIPPPPPLKKKIPEGPKLSLQSNLST